MTQNPLSSARSNRRQSTRVGWGISGGMLAAPIGLGGGIVLPIHALIALARVPFVPIDVDMLLSYHVVVLVTAVGALTGTAGAFTVGWKCGAKLFSVPQWTIRRGTALGAAISLPYAVIYVVLQAAHGLAERCLIGLLLVIAGGLLGAAYATVTGVRPDRGN